MSDHGKSAHESKSAYGKSEPAKVELPTHSMTPEEIKVIEDGIADRYKFPEAPKGIVELIEEQKKSMHQ